MKGFPSAGKGEVRHVIRLPERGDETRYRVELIIGRDMLVDCNRRWFGGKLERLTVAGWGYAAFRLVSVAGPATTMMACPDTEPRSEFVVARLENPFVPYDSSMPVVVYVPATFGVHYRVWSVSADERPALIE